MNDDTRTVASNLHRALKRKINARIYPCKSITCRATSLPWRERITHETRNRKKKRTSYFVYMLLCDDGSYYTGYTSNVQSRFEQHKKRRGARYTKMHEPKRIVYLQRFTARRTAMRRERQMKAFSHDQKRDLARRRKLNTVGYWGRKPLRVT
jgi:putative endonuclease